MGYGDDEGNGKDGSCGLLGRLGGFDAGEEDAVRCGKGREAPVPGLGKREEGRVALG